MRARSVYALVEGDGGAEQGGESHGARDVSEAGEACGPPQGERAHGGERLGSIEQRETFLGFKADGLDAGALCVIGEGEAIYRGERLPGRTALERAGIEPVRLEAKEGLALLNGTQALTAVG